MCCVALRNKPQIVGGTPIRQGVPSLFSPADDQSQTFGGHHAPDPVSAPTPPDSSAFPVLVPPGAVSDLPRRHLRGSPTSRRGSTLRTAHLLPDAPGSAGNRDRRLERGRQGRLGNRRR